MLVSDWIESLGFGRAQWFMAIPTCGVWMADGAELLLIASVTRAVAFEWGLSGLERSMATAIVFVGVLIGNFLSGSYGYGNFRKGLFLIRVPHF